MKKNKINFGNSDIGFGNMPSLSRIQKEECKKGIKKKIDKKFEEAIRTGNISQETYEIMSEEFQKIYCKDPVRALNQGHGLKFF